MSLYRIKMNGKIYEMEIDLIEEGKPKKNKNLPVEHKSVIQETSVVEESKEDNPNAITAPMPGSVIQILVKVGDEVVEGDVVIVLEAMKMENEICAPRAGRIKAIYISEGQNVLSDTPLYELEE